MLRDDPQNVPTEPVSLHGTDAADLQQLSSIRRFGLGYGLQRGVSEDHEGRLGPSLGRFQPPGLQRSQELLVERRRTAGVTTQLAFSSISQLPPADKTGAGTHTATPSPALMGDRNLVLRHEACQETGTRTATAGRFTRP